MKFKDLKVGDSNVELYALVIDCKTKQTVNQTPYFGLTISDGDDQADARIWTVNIVNTLKDKAIIPGEVYKFVVKVNDYAGKNQIIIGQVEDVDPNVVDLSSFYKSAPITEEELRKEIKGYIQQISNPVLKKIVVDLIGKNADKYFRHQAAITMHHNYRSGLVYHVYSMLKLAKQMMENYPALNQDLLYSGILIHDIGKTVEITSDKTPSYSLEGNLLGHIVIGLTMLAEVVKENGFEKTEEAIALEHMIAAHHGELEYGSPKEPMIAEAVALYLIDLTDSKLTGITEIVSKTEKGTYTTPVPTLGRKALYVPKID